MMLKINSRAWLLSWLIFSAVLVLDDVIIWAVKGHFPSAGMAADRISHTLANAAFLSWVMQLPRPGWWIAGGAVFVTNIVGIAALIGLEKMIVLPPMADAVVTELIFCINYLVAAGAVVVWLKRKAS